MLLFNNDKWCFKSVKKLYYGIMVFFLFAIALIEISNVSDCDYLTYQRLKSVGSNCNVSI